MSWTAADIPDQTGQTAVVTGANSGIGLIAARELARAGATVVMACRDQGKGEDAIAELRKEVPGAEPQLRRLDLASLASVREFATAVSGQHGSIDLLVNNAGVMATPRRETADGFELQLGTNHLGHFALTGLLLQRLNAGPEPRVVTVTSTAHRTGRINFDDLQGEKRYFRWAAYGQSKLANLLFAYELQRRAEAAGLELRSIAAHPGYSATNLQSAGPGLGGGIGAAFNKSVMAVTNRRRRAKRRGGRPSDPLRGDGSGAAGRDDDRSRRAVSDAGRAQGRLLQRRLARRSGGDPPLGGLRAADRGQLRARPLSSAARRRASSASARSRSYVSRACASPAPHQRSSSTSPLGANSPSTGSISQ